MNTREWTTKLALLWQNKQLTSNNMEAIMHVTLYFWNATNCRREHSLVIEPSFSLSHHTDSQHRFQR